MTREGPRRSGCFVQDAPAEAMDRLESPWPMLFAFKTLFAAKLGHAVRPGPRWSQRLHRVRA